MCFADTPTWAWALSAGFSGAPGSEDLWQTWLHDLQRLGRVTMLSAPDRPSGLHEVRSFERVPKSALWHVGTRARGRTSR